LDQAIQTRKTIVLLLFYKTITLWFSCLDGLIQTLGNVAQVKKSAQNHSPSARVSRAFLNSRNIPATLRAKSSRISSRQGTEKRERLQNLCIFFVEPTIQKLG
jgi:hypothetical protein